MGKSAGVYQGRSYTVSIWPQPCLLQIRLTIQRVSADLHGVCAPRVLCISVDKQKAVFFEMLKWVSLPAERKPSLYVYANFSFSLHPADFTQWRYSEYCVTPTHWSCGIQYSQNSLSLSPFSPMKGNWKQRLQLVRQLDSYFVSSTHPQTLIAYYFPPPIFHLPFICSFVFFFLFFFPHLPLHSIKSHLGDIHCNVFFLHTEII